MDTKPITLSATNIPLLKPDLLSDLDSVLFDLFKSPLIEIKDFSIGCDQSVIYIKTSSGQQAIIKAPKTLPEDKSAPDYFPMHLPSKQAWALKVFEQHNLLSPRLIYLDEGDRFIIETYLPETNYSNIEASKKEKEEIFSDLGKEMKRFHQMKSNKYGYIIYERENEGRFANWFEMFETLQGDIEELYKEKRIDLETKGKLQQIFEEQKEYLKEFKGSCLLHADLSMNNIRVKKVDNEWRFAGLIDFADLIAGDPLYDIGRFLIDFVGEWENVDYMAKGYAEKRKFVGKEKKIIRFYAVYFCAWMLSYAEGEEMIEKRKKTLRNLINSEFGDDE